MNYSDTYGHIGYSDIQAITAAENDRYKNFMFYILALEVVLAFGFIAVIGWNLWEFNVALRG